MRSSSRRLPAGWRAASDDAYGIRGAFNHNWDPYWSSSLFGSYSSVRYDDVAKANFCAVYTPGKAVSADFVCNTDFNVSSSAWSPAGLPSRT